MVLADSYRIPLTPYYSGYFRETLYFYLQDYHLLWLNFPKYSANIMFYHSLIAMRYNLKVPLHQMHNDRTLECALRFRLFPVRSPLLGKSIFFFFLGLLRCFTSPSCLSFAYEFSKEYSAMTLSGFPHSDIIGSQAASASPMLFAGNHVLHRLLVPRHPPYALSNSTKNLYWTHIDPSFNGRCINKLVKINIAYVADVTLNCFAIATST